MGPGTLVFLATGALMGIFTLVRAALLIMNWADVPHHVWPLAHALAIGFCFDALMAGVLASPAILWGTFAPSRLFHTKTNYYLQRLAYGIFLAVFFFLAVVELAFFGEFNARFNYIAVDYLLFPTEVAGNIWQSYPVLWALLGVLLAASAAAWAARRLFKNLQKQRAPFVNRLGLLATFTAVLFVLSRALSLQTLEVSRNRILNEIAANSYYNFLYAFISNDLDYGQHYKTIPQEEAVRRAAELITEDEGVFLTGKSNPLERALKEDGPLKDPNIVILVEESFGAKFTGVLGRHPENITPRFDALAKKGVLFTNFYATGSRTIRGLEAILCGFPPVPGASILKRDKSEDIFTLADVFKLKGYETLFVYGGRGTFDKMRKFMLRNGFSRFIEQKDFERPAFTTIWGVSDEDIFHRTLKEIDALDRGGKKFFCTVLSVSNHKPYTYPPGRIDLDPNRRRRENAVKYSDWALGDFFEKAEKYPFFQKTVFVVIGDHGARVYGADFIPIESYEIPFLIYSPLIKPGRMDTLACSMDVAPTILGLTDFSFQSVFFGRDLFDVDPKEGYALMQHDRNIGMLKGNRMAILGALKDGRTYDYDKAAHAFKVRENQDELDKRLLKDCISIYQTAYSFYKSKIYKLF